MRDLPAIVSLCDKDTQVQADHRAVGAGEVGPGVGQDDAGRGLPDLVDAVVDRQADGLGVVDYVRTLESAIIDLLAILPLAASLVGCSAARGFFTLRDAVPSAAEVVDLLTADATVPDLTAADHEELV